MDVAIHTPIHQIDWLFGSSPASGGNSGEYGGDLSALTDLANMRECLSIAAVIYRLCLDWATRRADAGGAHVVGVWLILFWLLLAAGDGDVYLEDE